MIEIGAYNRNNKLKTGSDRQRQKHS